MARFSLKRKSAPPEAQPKVFMLSDAERATGEPGWKILNFKKFGLFAPSVQKSRGRGTRNIFSHADIYKIALLGRLSQDGFDLRGSFLKTLTLIQIFEPTPQEIIAAVHGRYDHHKLNQLDESQLQIEYGKELQRRRNQPIDRSGRDRVLILSPEAGTRRKGAFPHGDVSGRTMMIDRATKGGRQNLRIEMERRLREFGSVYALEIDVLLDEVDARL